MAAAMADADERFDALQRKLIPLWQTLSGFNDEEQAIVVVPSMSIDAPFLKGPLLQAYEERFLFMLFLLRQPRARLLYVTSQTVAPSIVDYYLGLLPGVIASHARRRLHLLSADDDAPRPLSGKLLERPTLLQHLRSLIPDPDDAECARTVVLGGRRENRGRSARRDRARGGRAGAAGDGELEDRCRERALGALLGHRIDPPDRERRRIAGQVQLNRRSRHRVNEVILAALG